MIIEAIWEVIAPSKENSPLRSPSILSRETRIGVSKFWLEYITELVDGVLKDQIWRISEHRLESNKFYDRLAKKSTSHEYTELNPRTLLRILGSYVRKSQLRDKNDDHTRLSAVEAHELERLYEFLKTEDGRQLLHKGIIDAMELDFPYLWNIDSDRLKSLDFLYSESVSKELAKRVRDLAEFMNGVEESWNSVDEYIDYLRNILIWYYQDESESLQLNSDRCTDFLVNLRGPQWAQTYKQVEQDFNTFRDAYVDATNKLLKLIDDQWTDTLDKVQAPRSPSTQK